MTHALSDFQLKNIKGTCGPTKSFCFLSFVPTFISVECKGMDSIVWVFLAALDSLFVLYFRGRPLDILYREYGEKWTALCGRTGTQELNFSRKISETFDGVFGRIEGVTHFGSSTT
jgi:hypothetical protein